MGIPLDIIRVASMVERGANRNGSAGNPQPPPTNVLGDLPDTGAILTADQVEPDTRLADTLDETAAFASRHIAAPDTYADAMALIAGQSYVLADLVTTMRVLFHSTQPESGKTAAMMVLASLCYNPQDTTGSYPALTSRLAAAGTENNPCPTLYYDEIQRIFGPGGTRGGNHPLAEILRKGYKRTAKSSWSVDRSPVDFSIFATFLLAGLQTAVPSDIRTRCIAFEMHPGKPREYFDVRNAEAEAHALASSLSAAVKAHRDDIRRFRARGIHPKLTGRKLEIWEGMFAVAASAGQEWLNKCRTCFCELALDETDQPVFTPRQMVVRDLAETVLPAVSPLTWNGEPYIGGMTLVDELKRIDHPLYDGRSDASLACLIRDSLPIQSERHRIGGVVVRGYPVAGLVAAWDAIRPAVNADVEVPPEDNPFEETDDVTDDDGSVTG